MKKVLLATTMLAGTAGFASAEVSVSGYAEIGIWSYNHDINGVWSGEDGVGAITDSSVAFFQDVEVTFTMTGTTDGGLEFGAKIDLDEGDVGLNDDSGTEVWVSGAFGKLTMGDTDGAIDWALADAGTLTSLADDHTTHVAYFGATGFDGKGDGQVVRYENTFGDFGFAISAEQVNNGVEMAGVNADDIFGIGVKYSADLGGTTVNFGLAYQTGALSVTRNAAGVMTAAGNGDAVGVSVGAGLAGGFSATLGYIQYDYDAPASVDYSHTGLGLNYASGPISVNVNYGVIDPDTGADTDSWGLAANYDLGGGAVVMFGYGSDVSTQVGNQDQWSLGLGLSF